MVMSWTCVVLAIEVERQAERDFVGTETVRQEFPFPTWIYLLRIALAHAVIVPCRGSHRLQNKPGLDFLLIAFTLEKDVSVIQRA